MNNKYNVIFDTRKIIQSINFLYNSEKMVNFTNNKNIDLMIGALQLLKKINRANEKTRKKFNKNPIKEAGY